MHTFLDDVLHLFFFCFFYKKKAQTYFRDRHINFAVIVNSNWDPRTLEGKFVRDEPFKFDDAAVSGTGAKGPASSGGTGIARPLRNSSTGAPVNGNFEQVQADGKTPVGWTFALGTDKTIAPACSLDKVNGADGTVHHSVKCDVQHYPGKDPFPPTTSATPTSTTGAPDASVSTSLHNNRNPMHPYSSSSSSSRGRGRKGGSNGLQSEPMHYNYSGTLTSDPIAIEPGSTYSLTFKSAWNGNWTGAFTAIVSLYQYETELEANNASESVTDPAYPYTYNFLPCPGGDARHCGSRPTPTLPAWGDNSKTFMTLPTAKYIKIRSYVAGWGAGT